MKIFATAAKWLEVGALLFIGSVFLNGCATRHRTEYEFSEEIQAARLPEFLVGPASALLTNATGFSARVTVEEPGRTNKTSVATGQLLLQESHILFAPKAGDRAFIWDAEQRAGYMLSDALQGYAPISSALHVTNVMTISEMAGSTESQVNGHRGHEAEVSVASDDGSVARFSIWRADDLNGFPVRITSMNATPAFVVNVLDLRPEKLATRLFLPPDGFTPYASADAMVSELYSRKSKLKRSYSGATLPPQDERTPSTHYSR